VRCSRGAESRGIRQDRQKKRERASQRNQRAPPYPLPPRMRPRLPRCTAPGRARVGISITHTHSQRSIKAKPKNSDKVSAKRAAFRR
jgi:hypothetical protein